MEAEAVDEETQAALKRVGQTLGGKWQLDKVLGVGGMAAVYSATHKNNLKNVAVKVLHAQLQTHETIRTRFLREGYVANKVGHPGAVSAIDDGIDTDGAVFLVMELLLGQSLAQRLDDAGGKLAPREVLTITDGILDVLAAAHMQHVVHRDLKPDNIFLTEEGGVKVLDFGVARVLDARAEEKTRTGLVMGTPEYMPQEQARGRSELIDGRTDLWAVGAIMFRLLTSRYVHLAETQNEVLLKAMTEPAPRILEIAPTVPTNVAAIVDRALAYEPKDRYPDAESMQVAVKEALAALLDQDAKATGRITAEQLAALDKHGDDDVDDGAKTIPVSDFARQKTAPAASEVQSGTTPTGNPSKPNLWVHTKATPIEPPRAPKKKSRLVPIVLGLIAVGALSAGGFYEWQHRGGPMTSASDAASLSAVAVQDDPDADTDGGDDEMEMDDDDAATAPVSSFRPSPSPSNRNAGQTKPKLPKKKRRR